MLDSATWIRDAAVGSCIHAESLSDSNGHRWPFIATSVVMKTALDAYSGAHVNLPGDSGISIYSGPKLFMACDGGCIRRCIILNGDSLWLLGAGFG
jgi:hypothetical protein